MKPEAMLIPTRVEVATKDGGYKWVDGYQIISPEGKEIFPYMRKAVARRYCRTAGWSCWVSRVHGGDRLVKDFTDFMGFFTKGAK